LVWAGRGLGAWHEAARFNKSVPAKVSDCRKIDEALFLTSEVLTFDKSNRQDSYKRLERSVRLSRTWGDAYGYFLVATGRAEIMIDPMLSDWDAGPLLVILEEAGGRFTDWRGNATIFGQEGVGTNGFLHDNVLQIINET
jgi:fructose-1,6-bisphosphatase/inositol monophosphatase family enzyme